MNQTLLFSTGAGDPSVTGWRHSQTASVYVVCTNYVVFCSFSSFFPISENHSWREILQYHMMMWIFFPWGLFPTDETISRRKRDISGLVPRVCIKWCKAGRFTVKKILWFLWCGILLTKTPLWSFLKILIILKGARTNRSSVRRI